MRATSRGGQMHQYFGRNFGRLGVEDAVELNDSPLCQRALIALAFVILNRLCWPRIPQAAAHKGGSAPCVIDQHALHSSQALACQSASWSTSIAFHDRDLL